VAAASAVVSAAPAPKHPPQQQPKAST